MEMIIKRVSDQSTRCEYDPIEIKKIDKEDIIKKFGRCEFGEIIYVEVDGELVLTLYWDSQYKEYREPVSRY